MPHASSSSKTKMLTKNVCDEKSQIDSNLMNG